MLCLMLNYPPMKPFSFFVIVCLGTIFGCSDQDLKLESFSDDQSIQTINGTWKVESFENFQTETIEYQTRENSWGYDIILTFDDTGSPKVFSGQVTSNSVAGQFDYVGDRRLKVLNYSSTYINQPEWGNAFSVALSGNEVAFQINTTQLRILYDGDSKSVTLRRQ